MAEITRFSMNAAGRDFVVGDLHGMYTALDQLLEEVGFDTAVDRLFSVGDLADRGPESPSALIWLEQPWFHCVRGNHDQFIIDCRSGMEVAMWVANNGGEWWVDVDEVSRDRFRAAIDSLPYGMEVETQGGLVAIVHADVPYGMSWPKFCKAVARDDAKTLETAIWSRKRVRDILAGRNVPAVGGCDLLISGHTPVKELVDQDGFVCLDTGAAYVDKDWSALSLYQIHPQRGPYWRLETTDAYFK